MAINVRHKENKKDVSKMTSSVTRKEEQSQLPKHLYLKYTGCTQKNGAVSKVNKKFISHLTRAQHTP
jgi:hypothetical protein